MKQEETMDQKPLVQLTDIHKWFGRVCALEGVELDVDYSEIDGGFSQGGDFH
jgi:ABC-type sugar transport system ATPase subunit